MTASDTEGVVETAVEQYAAEALDHVSIGLCALSAGLTVIMFNAEFRALMRASGALRIEDNRLYATEESDHASLQQAVLVANNASLLSTTSFVPLIVGRRSGKPGLQCLVRPLDLARQDGGRVLLFATDPARPIKPHPALVQQLLGFTRIEAIVATGLISGARLAEIAAQIGEPVAVVRNAMRGACRKLEAATARELAAKVLALIGKLRMPDYERAEGSGRSATRTRVAGA